MRYLFTCGGTAGHINPALAVAAELKVMDSDARFLFVGAGNKMERHLIPAAGYELKNIKMSGLRRGILPGDIRHNINTMKNLMRAGAEAEKIIAEFGPDAAIGTGGYICYPVLKKAAKMGIPTVVHESNAAPGLTTKMLSGVVDKTLISFRGMEKSYRIPERVIFTGTPIRRVSEQNCGCVRDRGQTFDKPLVLSFWGSLGAAHMNEIIIEFMKLNIRSGVFHHIHAAGKLGDVSDMKHRLLRIAGLDELPGYVEIVEYIDDMADIMRCADVVLARAGGSTIAELTAMGKPAVLIPSPYVSNNEQELNALQIQKSGGAVVLKERDCTGALLYETVTDILCDEDRRNGMRKAQEAAGAPDAAENVARLISNLRVKSASPR